MIITTTQIIQEVNSDFASAYKNAAPFIGSGDLWNFCMTVLANIILVNNIVFANDLGIPPVKSLLFLYEKQFAPAKDFKFTRQESQWLGCLMGFLFKNVLKYQAQKDRNQVNWYGVGTAARFYDAPDELTIE